jgi:hypothetical protein
MMKRLLLASTLLLPVATHATPLDQANTLAFIKEAMATCLAGMNNNNAYCSCYVLAAANRSTMEDGAYFIANGKLPADYVERVAKPSIADCLKPPVSDKNWWQVW